MGKFREGSRREGRSVDARRTTWVPALARGKRGSTVFPVTACSSHLTRRGTGRPPGLGGGLCIMESHSLMRQWLYHMTGFGEHALPAPVAAFGCSASNHFPISHRLRHSVLWILPAVIA